MDSKATVQQIGGGTGQVQSPGSPHPQPQNQRVIMLCDLYQKHVENIPTYLRRQPSPPTSEASNTCELDTRHILELIGQYEFGEDWRSSEERHDLALRTATVRLQKQYPSATNNFSGEDQKWFESIANPVVLKGLLHYVFVTSENKWCDLHTGTMMLSQALSTAHAHEIENLPGEIRRAAGKMVVSERGWWPGKDQIYSYKGKRCINTYRPSDLVQHRKPGDVTWWLDHLARVIPDKSQQENVQDWQAYALQYPGRKINYHLLIGGDSGIGKDSLFQPFLRGVGTFAEVGESSLKWDFEDHLDESKLVCVQEISSFVGNQKLEDKLKSQLANPPETLLINPKSRGKKEVPNLMNWIFYSNRPYPLNLSENDRRVFCVWCAPTHADAMAWNKEGYFQRYYDQLNNSGDYAVVDWLLRRDVSAFNPAGHPPMSGWKLDIISQSGGGLVVRLRELKNSNAGPFQLSLIRTEDVRVMVPELNIESDTAISSALKQLGCEKPKHRAVKKIKGKSYEYNLFCTGENESLATKTGAELFEQYWLERLEVQPLPDRKNVPTPYLPAREKIREEYVADGE